MNFLLFDRPHVKRIKIPSEREANIALTDQKVRQPYSKNQLCTGSINDPTKFKTTPRSKKSQKNTTEEQRRRGLHTATSESRAPRFVSHPVGQEQTSRRLCAPGSVTLWNTLPEPGPFPAHTPTPSATSLPLPTANTSLYYITFYTPNVHVNFCSFPSLTVSE